MVVILLTVFWHQIRDLFGIRTTFIGRHWPGGGPNATIYASRRRRYETGLAPVLLPSQRYGQYGNRPPRLEETCVLLREPENSVRQFMTFARKEVETAWWVVWDSKCSNMDDWFMFSGSSNRLLSLLVSTTLLGGCKIIDKGVSHQPWPLLSSHSWLTTMSSLNLPCIRRSRKLLLLLDPVQESSSEPGNWRTFWSEEHAGIGPVGLFGEVLIVGLNRVVLRRKFNGDHSLRSSKPLKRRLSLKILTKLKLETLTKQAVGLLMKVRRRLPPSVNQS